MLGLLCVEWNGAGSNLAVRFTFFFPLSYFSKFWQFAFVLDRICVVTGYSNKAAIEGNRALSDDAKEVLLGILMRSENRIV